jgi:cyclopropane fatty-acyl-phospholipid synthase-like methyltransferase
MNKEREWEVFFDHHAPKYMDEVFTKNTAEEVEFLIEELQLPEGGAILDVGCGTGRHAVELAKRGYRITGIDLSLGMLAEAKRTADEAGVELELIHADAAKYRPEKKFDGVICLCEGAFALIGKGEDPIEHDLAILRNINYALKPDSIFILDTLNGLEKIRKYNIEDIQQKKFNQITLVETFRMDYTDDDGNQKTVTVREKGYVGSELKLMLRIAGFEAFHFYGSTAGNWGHREVDPDEIGMMAIARKIREL